MKAIRKLVAPTIWLIVISFALWGAQSFFLGFKKETLGAGKAFGKIITFKKFQDAMRSAQLLLEKPGAEKTSPEKLEEAAWQNIVLGAEAKQQKVHISDKEVIAEIQRLFGVDERMDQATYQQWIFRNFGEQPRAFEERIREILQIQKLLAQHETQEATVTDEEVEQVFFDSQNKLTTEYTAFDTLEKLNEFKTQLAQAPSFWEDEKKKENSNIKPFGPASVAMLMAVYKVSREDVDQLLSLPDGTVSAPVQFKNGFALIKIMGKELAAKEKYDEETKRDFKERLLEQKKQAAFFDWWNDVMKRASVEKFGKPSGEEPGQTDPMASSPF